MCNVTARINYLTRKEFLRRSGLLGAAAIGGAALAGCSNEADEPGAAQGETTASERSQAQSPARIDANTKVVLLGVGGGPTAKSKQNGISQAVVVGDGVYLVDCGTGLFDQLFKAGLIGRIREVDRIRNIFLTHLHSDHTADYFSFLLLGWPMKNEVHTYGPGRPDQLPRPFAKEPEGGFPVVDPLGITPVPGIQDMTKFSTAAFAYDINVRMRDEGLPNMTDYVVPHDIELPEGVGRDYVYEKTDRGAVGTAPGMEPFEVLPKDDNGVSVKAILVNHAPVFPSFAYRFDTPDGSIVVSGDTSPSENLIKLAQGANVLVHEVLHRPSIDKLIPEYTPNRDALLYHIYESHTSSTDVGKVAQNANVEKLMLTHFGPADGIVPDDVWRNDVKKNFDGEVFVGKDLMEVGLP